MPHARSPFPVPRSLDRHFPQPPAHAAPADRALPAQIHGQIHGVVHGLLPGLLLALLLALLPAPGVQAASGEAATPEREGILLVAFGTSVPEATASFTAIDAAFKKAWPDSPVVWAYTSQIIRKKLAREGRPVGGIAAGLDRLAADGVTVVRVQSLHVMAGEEFAALARAVLLNIQKHPGRFKAVYLGRPLLESREDAQNAAKAVLGALAARRQAGDALVLMGHGQEHGRADLVFEGARSVFQSSDPVVFLATVEGSRGFDELLAELRARKVRRVWLQPLMLVAGDHARNDLAGEEEDSWASRLRAAGFTVMTNLTGLGEIPGIAAIYVQHARGTADDLTREPRKE